MRSRNSSVNFGHNYLQKQSFSTENIEILEAMNINEIYKIEYELNNSEDIYRKYEEYIQTMQADRQAGKHEDMTRMERTSSSKAGVGGAAGTMRNDQATT